MNPAKLPSHIAIIMDGNGRWAKKRNLSRIEGHIEGARRVDDITTAARKAGIRYLTLYSFSTENWSRPEIEISALFSLLKKYLKSKKKTLLKNDIRLATIGDLSRFPGSVRQRITSVKKATAKCRSMTLVLALNYGSRDEIFRAVKKMLKRGEASAEKLPEYLDTAGMPDPELLIRTSGEKRLSNFLLYQSAYTEFYFTKKHWPEFDEKELRKAIEDFAGRKRRFGGL